MFSLSFNFAGASVSMLISSFIILFVNITGHDLLTLFTNRSVNINQRNPFFRHRSSSRSLTRDRRHVKPASLRSLNSRGGFASTRGLKLRIYGESLFVILQQVVKKTVHVVLPLRPGGLGFDL